MKSHKKYLVGLFIAFCVTSNQTRAQITSNLPKGWFSDFDEAKENALRENKLLFVTFDWQPDVNELRQEAEEQGSGWIVHQYKTLIPWSQLVTSDELTSKTSCVRIPLNKGLILRQEYAKKPNSYIILDAYGNEFLNPEDFKSAMNLAQAMQALSPDVSKAYDLLRSLIQHPDSTELTLALADQYQKYHGFGLSNKYYKEVMKSKLAEADPKLLFHVRSSMALNYYLLGDNSEAKDRFEECIKEYPQSADRPKQLFLLAKILMGDEESDKARKYYEMLQKEFPNDAFTQLAKALFEK